METGLEIFQKFTVGLMIIVSQELNVILYLKLFHYPMANMMVADTNY
jgi:hypothetical protein